MSCSIFLGPKVRHTPGRCRRHRTREFAAFRPKVNTRAPSALLTFGATWVASKPGLARLASPGRGYMSALRADARAAHSVRQGCCWRGFGRAKATKIGWHRKNRSAKRFEECDSKKTQLKSLNSERRVQQFLFSHCTGPAAAKGALEVVLAISVARTAMAKLRFATLSGADLTICGSRGSPFRLLATLTRESRPWKMLWVLVAAKRLELP